MSAQPRASILLLAYNQERTVQCAAASCLAQDCEPLEIILSDDASTDSTFALLQAIAADYRGPHRVWARRNVENLGIGAHYNELLAASRGQLLVSAAGDDISEPDRVRRLLAAWDATDGRADLIASHVIDLDIDDEVHEIIRVDDLSVYKSPRDWASRRPYIIGAGHAFTRRMMARFGPLAREVFYEDQIMVFRAIASGGAVTVDAPLVRYRRGGTSRKLVFDSAEQMHWWTHRQLERELAEVRQLISDAQVAGCEPLVRDHVVPWHTKATYLARINEARSWSERRAAYDEAALLPRWWRVRKIFPSIFPRGTFLVRKGLVAIHAWRVRLGLSRRKHEL